MDIFLDTTKSVDFKNDVSGFVAAQKAGFPQPPPCKEFEHPEPAYRLEVRN